MNVHGREIAADILARTKGEVEDVGRTFVVRAVVVAPTPATASYMRIKSQKAQDAGMKLLVQELSPTSSTEEVIAAVQEPGADAVIVQLPLPLSIDTERVLAAIPQEFDADCLSAASRGEGSKIIPPVAAAVDEICIRMNVSVKGKRAVVIGNGWLVGNPVAAYLCTKGAEVTVATRATEDLARLLTTADIIVSGAGVAGLITPDVLKQGVVLIDAGTSESNGALRGDATPECGEVASVFTPVPGGVGPIAVACLFENVAKLAQTRGEFPNGAQGVYPVR